MSTQADSGEGAKPVERAGFVWRDGIERYGVVSRLNHWLGAALILTLLAIGLYFEDMPRGAEKLFWMKLHIGIGALAFFILAFRLVWRLSSRGPAPFPQSVGMQRLAQATHVLLLAGIGVLIVSGPLGVWSGGHALDIFGWFSIPSPTGKIEALHKVLEIAHKLSAKIVLVAVILHVLAAAKHLLFDRRRLLGRMVGR
ncbi:cytochrome b [Acidihalobacter prosperus]